VCPNRPRSIRELFADDALITGALTRATREAVLQHARLGHPVATMRDGKVVWLSPEEVLAALACPPDNGGPSPATSAR
jgi:hypothetical protein